MLATLIILFTVFPALELYILIKVGTFIGALNTILIIIGTGIVGAAMARYQGFRALHHIQEELNRGMMPSTQLLDGAMILTAGVLLLTPGFITDIFGFLLLFPWFRGLLKRLLKHRFQQMIQTGQAAYFGPNRFNSGPYDDIDIG